MKSFLARYGGKIKVGSIIVMILSILLIMRTLPMEAVRQELERWIGQLGVWGPTVFAAIYIAATVCFVPGSLLTLAAGAVFGLWSGFLVVSAASVTGAALAFLIARYIARSKIERMAKNNPKFGAIDEAISEGGWKIVGMLRLSPAIPFNLQNYLYGLTDVKFWTYVWASWIAMIPGTFMYVYLGHVAGAAAAGGDRNLGQWVMLGIGCIATVAVTIYITRLAKKKLDEKTDLRSQQNDDVKEKDASGKAIAYACTAGVLLALAIFAQVKSDVIAKFVMSSIASGPPKVTMKESYDSNPEGPSVDHSLFDKVLGSYVQEGGWVDYAGLKDNQKLLDEYIATIASMSYDDLGRDEKLALLINAYNAFTMKLIIEHFPIASIKDIPAEKRWEAQRWTVGEYTWSLNQIEHEQIRPNFKEPRIHFALVCAAVGCPPLATEAYSANHFEEQLERQTQYVHDHRTWFQFEPGKNLVHLTRLYDWYGSDFSQVAGSPLQYAARYVSDLERTQANNKELKTQFLDYDWGLNSVENMEAR